MENIYIIVHEEAVHSNDSNDPRQPIVLQELELIKENYQWIALGGIPDRIPVGIHIDHHYFVTGAFYTGFHQGLCDHMQCVDKQLEALLEQGFSAEVFEPACLYSRNNANYSRQNTSLRQKLKEKLRI